MTRYNRRDAFLATTSFLISGSLLAAPALAQGESRVVIVGGGFGGASAARTLTEIAPEIDVTLIVDTDAFSTCPFSNLVIAGEIPLSRITFGYDGLASAGVNIRRGRAVEIDADSKLIALEDGSQIAFDRAIVSPGIDLKFSQIPGYDKAAAEMMPHAWQGGAQAELLRDQLAAMREGGTVLMSVPNNPYRCPPGPYERASLMAHFLSRTNPSAKIIIIDGKDRFSKQSLFKEGWERLYPGMITHVPFAENAGVIEVKPDRLEIETSFETFKGDVVNFIPPQSAAAVLLNSGLGGNGEWCEIDQATFESPLAPGVHVLGDSAIVGDMPKSGFSAAVQGAVCAHTVASLLKDEALPEGSVLLNTCYSLLAPDYGISVANVYRMTGEGRLAEVSDVGGISPIGASDDFRQSEADYARSWYSNITSHIFG